MNVNCNIRIGDMPTKERLERELFDIKMMMLELPITKPQEAQRLSNCLKTIQKCLDNKEYM